MKKKDLMDYEDVLPEDFKGTFLFTNWTDEEFVGIWGKKEYHFDAHTTSPMIIPEQTPLEVQWIRKKFAKDLAEREFPKTERYKQLFGREQDSTGQKRIYSLHQAGSYSIKDLEPLIEKCLLPLAESKVKVRKIEFVPMEEKLSRDEKGEVSTISLSGNDNPVEVLKKTHESLKRRNNI